MGAISGPMVTWHRHRVHQVLQSGGPITAVTSDTVMVSSSTPTTTTSSRASQVLLSGGPITVASDPVMVSSSTPPTTTSSRASQVLQSGGPITVASDPVVGTSPPSSSAVHQVLQSPMCAGGPITVISNTVMDPSHCGKYVAPRTCTRRGQANGRAAAQRRTSAVQRNSNDAGKYMCPRRRKHTADHNAICAERLSSVEELQKCRKDILDSIKPGPMPTAKREALDDITRTIGHVESKAAAELRRLDQHANSTTDSTAPHFKSNAKITGFSWNAAHLSQRLDRRSLKDPSLHAPCAWPPPTQHQILRSRSHTTAQA